MGVVKVSTRPALPSPLQLLSDIIGATANARFGKPGA
jgi:hypothetical protein